MTHGMDAGLLLIRVVLGITMFLHGYNKFFGGGRIPGTARWFDSMGMKPNGKVHAIMAASTETGAGLLFAAGLLTPFAAAGITALMIVAAWTVHRKEGFFIVKGGWEYNLILATTAIGVSSIGPGTYSLDNALKLGISTSHPKIAVAISVGLGVGSAVLLLATAYRPPAPAPAEPSPGEAAEPEVSSPAASTDEAATEPLPDHELATEPLPEAVATGEPQPGPD